MHQLFTTKHRTWVRGVPTYRQNSPRGSFHKLSSKYNSIFFRTVNTVRLDWYNLLTSLLVFHVHTRVTWLHFRWNLPSVNNVPGIRRWYWSPNLPLYYYETQKTIVTHKLSGVLQTIKRKETTYQWLIYRQFRETSFLTQLEIVYMNDIKEEKSLGWSKVSSVRLCFFLTGSRSLTRPLLMRKNSVEGNLRINRSD